MRKNIASKRLISEPPLYPSFLPHAVYLHASSYGHVSLVKIDPGRTYLWSSGLLADTLCVGLVTGFNLTDLLSITYSHILIKCPCRPLSFLLTSFRAFLSSFSKIDVHETFPSSPNQIVLHLWQSYLTKKTRIRVHCLKKTHEILRRLLHCNYIYRKNSEKRNNFATLGARSWGDTQTTK